jgi:nucleotide-binding universal stress UspA family protein
MNENIHKLLTAMDEKIWLRMLVCFLPGLAIGKLAGQHPSAILGVLGTVLLIVGVGAFLMWARLRGVLVDEEEHEDEDVAGQAEAVIPALYAAEPRSGAETAKLMTELLELFGGSGAQTIDAVQTE